MDNLKASKQADISIMRINATLAVIFLHTCNTISNNAHSYNLSKTQMFFLTSGTYLMSWAVPVFLMITGALFLSKKKVITYRECLLKYSKRILLALFVFGVPFSMLEIIMNTKRIDAVIFPEAILNVFTGNSWSHLWYLYALIGIYLVLPLIKAFVDKAERKDIEVILVVLFVFNFVFPVINKLFNIHIAFELPISSFPIFYVLLGTYMYRETPTMFRDKRACIGILLVAYVVMLVINRFTVPSGGALLGSNSPLIVIIASMIFLLIKGIKINGSENLWRLDRLCFGVYLVHPVFINFLYKFVKITPLNAGKLYPVAIVLFWILFSLCSFLSSWVMSKIKPLKKYIL